MIDFEDLGRDRLRAMAAAGADVVECERVLDKIDANVVGELLPADGAFYEFDHCPPGDIYDSETGSQYYYHAHRPGEHGHFHTFLRAAGMPAGLAPAPQSAVPEMAERDDAISHLIAISMDNAGAPIALFTTNRWLTGENWYKAADIEAMLDRFEIDHAQASWPANIWIGAMLRLFRPQIVDLLYQRDAAVADLVAAQPEKDVFEDRDVDALSYRAISIADQIQAVDAALKRL
jgi:hypothetical protein